MVVDGNVTARQPKSMAALVASCASGDHGDYYCLLQHQAISLLDLEATAEYPITLADLTDDRRAAKQAAIFAA